MKAICDNSPKPVTCGVKDGKVSKSKDKAVEAEEMQMYLTRLKELVPYMPKNKKISKLEVIQNVIDYIRDLQDALETVPPAKVSTSNQSNHHRQPLGVIATNFPLLNACSSYESTQLDKSPSSVERPVSC